MQRELIIGLAGVKGSGKSTVADMLAEMIPNVEIVAWADALKDDVLRWANRSTDAPRWLRGEREPLTRGDVEDHKAEIFGPLCQGYGALMRHYVDKDYWIEQWEDAAPERVIVPDCRHHNEADYIKANDGFLIYITGPSRWHGDTRSSTHESEKFVVELGDKADFIVYNDGTLEHLREQVKVLAEIIVEAGRHVGSAA